MSQSGRACLGVLYPGNCDDASKRRRRTLDCATGVMSACLPCCWFARRSLKGMDGEYLSALYSEDVEGFEAEGVAATQ